MTNRFIPLALCTGLLSCVDNMEHRTSFYKDEMEAHDVWRLPLVEPYQLLTAYCCEGWNWGPGSALHRDFGFAHSADSINVEQGFILIHTDDSGPSWFALELKTKKKFELEDRQAFNAFTNEHGIGMKLHSTQMVFEKWRSTGQLPWASEVLTQP